MSGPQESGQPAGDRRTRDRRHDRRSARRQRTVIGAWAVAGLRTGFFLGASIAAVLAVLVGLLFVFTSAANGTSGGAGGAVGFLALVTVTALVPACVIGALTGLTVGLADGCVLWLVSRTACFSSASPAGRRRLATATAVVSTVVVGIAAQDAWIGLRINGTALGLFFGPALIGGAVACRLSRSLPPLAPGRPRPAIPQPDAH